MKIALTVLFSILAGLLAGGIGMCAAPTVAGDTAAERKRLHDAFVQGNFKDSYDGLRKILLDKEIAPAGEDLATAIQCLERLNRTEEVDELLESAIRTHEGIAGRWSFLWDAASQYMQAPPQGFIVAGKFYRGNHRGGGRYVNVMARDRVRALQLMVEALPAALKDDSHPKVADFLLAMSDMWLNGRQGQIESWRLQSKTDLAVLPDYEDGWGYYGGQTQGAPVDETGEPIFHHVPKTFESSASDGERWRWCLAQAAEFDPARTNAVRWKLADFLWQQFDVQTLAAAGWQFGRGDIDDSQESQTGVFAINTLGEDETIARLATGVKRFKLPAEFDFITILEKIADDPKTGYGSDALVRLAQIFENRRQYPKAADYWRRVLKEYPGDPQIEVWKQQLEQIVANWGRFEPVMAQPAGQGATVEYRFRNGSAIELTATEVDFRKLLDDVKAYLKTRPHQIDGDRYNIGDIGYRLVTKDEKQYLGKQVASWRMEIKPRAEHFDKRVTIATPLQKAGAYLLKAVMANGNTSSIIVWINDTSIVKKALSQKAYYFVADAVSGNPVAKANLEFFGWKMNWTAPNNMDISIKDFAESADAEGQFLTDQSTQPNDYQWLVTATTPQGRLAYLGFSGIWYNQQYDAVYNQVKVYPITDRPVYRPDQPVKFKFWVGYAKYDLPMEKSDFAGHPFIVEIHNPKGEKVFTVSKKGDDYGGLDGEWKLPTDAPLGVYRLVLKRQDPVGAPAPRDPEIGSGNFRVEEYKKPEFEVTVDAPSDPVMLGEKITAKITAKYYFGSPVAKAKVKYKIERTTTDARWYPPGPWDWLFGEGYWWFAPDSPWYPGWSDWGCRRPYPMWWSRPQLPPELVADREVDIGPDGVVNVEIDTAVAKAVHPDQDHSYSITAEVVDESRRTIVGTGSVLVARKPFSVHAWVDRGYYRVKDTIQVGLAARRLDGKPVQGDGELTLLRITYKKDKPIESPVQTWKLATDDQGQAHQQITASQPGQYRISYKVTDSKKHTIEGGYLFTIIGEGFDSAQFRFNHLEIIPDKADYAPGEKMKLQINTDRAGGTVLLFARPTNSVYLKPTVLHLDGKSTIQEIEIRKADMPNFFVEAVTVAEGRVHTETREIVVPPEKRILTVEVLPSSATYRPGEKAKVQVKLTDYFGKPFVGSTVVAIYDKSVEYVSGGSNVPDIKEFFWKWRRSHYPSTESNLGGFSQNLVQNGARSMNDLGVFGGSVADEFSAEGVDGLGDAKGLGRANLGVLRKGGLSRLSASTMLEKDGAALMDAAAGIPAPAAPMAMAPAAGAKFATAAGNDKPGGAPLVQPTLRTKFADTALWVGNLTTQSNGTAEVALDMPENLTTWRIKVWGMGHGSVVGQGQTDVITRKDLIIRLEAPRYFIQNDEVVLSAVIHNYLKTKKQVQVSLEMEGNTLELIPEGNKLSPKPGHPVMLNTGKLLNPPVEIAPQGEARVDWRVKVLDEGEATIRMKALTDEESDAMEQKFPCYIHGMLKMEAYSGVIRGKSTAGQFSLTVPEARRPKQSRIEVRYSPTLAGAMVDALPYLVDYPYGCTEQTLNRFLPTVITQKVLLDMKLDLAEIRKKRTNLNAQEIGNDTERAKQWKRYDRNPVFDEDEVRKMVKDGVARLTEMQLSDGGWGWFSGFGEYSSPHTTALVVHGLQLAKQNDVAIVPGMIDRGVAWLTHYQDEQVQWIKNGAIEKKPPGLRWKDRADEMDAFVYMVLADAGVKNAEMRDFLYRDRTKLAVYALTMYGVALDKQGEKDKLAMVLKNISQYVQQDNENQTAWLNLPDGYWWYWYGSEYEAQAYYLKLLAKTDPKGELASRLVKYLLNNRKNATYWNSTRDTAIVIEAMADYIRASGESKPELTVQVLYDGKLEKSVEITPKTLFQFDNKFVLEGEKVASGKHTIELKKQGAGPLYYNGYVTNFTLEDFIKKAGLEIKVQRKYYKLVKADKSVQAAGSHGQVVDQKVEKYDRQELDNLATVESGDLVEIELEIDSKNDYEYLVFEDMKPAGFEPVDQRSGYTGNDLGAYVEYRDDRVNFFARTLARGKHSVSYRMRAEIPGKFSALPTRAWAMYAPELKANSDEIKLQVKDQK